MDDPTRWRENDASNGTRLQGLPVPSGSPTLMTPPHSATRIIHLLS